nr:hypothetical protein [Odoribacter sp. OF09-27XD]
MRSSLANSRKRDTFTARVSNLTKRSLSLVSRSSNPVMRLYPVKILAYSVYINLAAYHFFAVFYDVIFGYRRGDNGSKDKEYQDCRQCNNNGFQYFHV